MLFASLGGLRLEGAFKRGASCALFFEEGTQIDNTVESFVQNAEKAKTCGLGSTTNVVPLSQARGIRGLQYFPTQMVDGPMLAPNYTNLSSGSGNGMRFPAQVTPDWVFSTFLCAQGHPETVTTLDDVEVGDSSADIVQDADCTVGQQFKLSTKDIPLPEIANTISL